MNCKIGEPKSNYKILGDFIKKVDVRNRNGEVTNLLGLSMTKEFRESTSNIVGTDLSKYKIVDHWQFACDFMSVIRVRKLPVVLQKKNEKIIVSPAYVVFEVVDNEVLDPEYLMMWFRRSEFDRYAYFRCDSAVRGGFNWEELCEVELPISTIEKQREIVKEYNTIVNRIKLNEHLSQKLEETAQALYKHWFVDFEFPANLGDSTLSGAEGYKSSGGKMVHNAELDKEIPEGWQNGCLGDLIQLQRGFDLPTHNRIEGEFPIYASTGVSQFHNDFRVKGPGIITGRSGSLGEVFYIDEDFWPLNTTLWVKEFKNATPIFTYFVLKGINIKDYNSGSAVPSLNRNYIHMHELVIPLMNIIESFEGIETTLFKYKKNLTLTHKSLCDFLEIISSKMSKFELEGSKNQQSQTEKELVYNDCLCLQ